MCVAKVRSANNITICGISHTMESEYFESSWKVRVEWIRRRLRTVFQSTMARYYRSKRKGYTRFLTEEEQRCRIFFAQTRDFAIYYIRPSPINLIIRTKLINLSKILLNIFFLSFHSPNSIKNKLQIIYG